MKCVASLSVAFAALILAATSFTTVRGQSQSDLFFSEYIEGSSNNKALEIYNGTGSPVDLAASGYQVRMYFNGSAAAGLTINLTGTVAPGDVFVLAQSSANATILAAADQTNGSGWFNGDDAVALWKGNTLLDVIGVVGSDPGTEWGSGLASTADNTLRRKSTVCAGDTDPADAFDPAAGWNGFATDDAAGLGSHSVACAPPVDTAAPSVSSTTPADGGDIAIGGTISVTFSEPVSVQPGWYTLVCAGEARSASVTGGPVTFTIDPDAGLPEGQACVLTIVASLLADVDTLDPPDTMVADRVVTFTPRDACALPYTATYTIQGRGAATTIPGPASTFGVVVGDYERPSGAGQIRGFYIQDLTGDGDALTSDGLFVFNGNDDSVKPGDTVRVSGTVAEFQGQTQISASSVVVCGSGAVAPSDVTLPLDSAEALERYEGMLVRLPQPLYVTEHFQLGRFGQIVVSSGDRLVQPTHVFRPGSDANALQAQNSLNRLIIDDDNNLQNPDPIVFGRNGQPLSASNTLRGGDVASGIVGVLVYGWAGNDASGNAYRVRPVGALNGTAVFAAGNPRPAAAPATTATLRVASMNVLNYFNTFGATNCSFGVGGAVAECRGAGNAAEFDRQWPKTIAAILGSRADVVGLIEIENDGYGGTSAVQDVVTKLNAATAAGTYAFIDADSATGQINALGTDAIKVALIYRSAAVVPIGVTAALNSTAFVNGGDTAPRTRPALAQAFESIATAGRFVVVVNHFKSKGSECDAPDAGDGQGNCNAVRVNAATELAHWLSGDPTRTGEPDLLILGDLNAYAKEDPVVTLEAAGFVNLVPAFGGPHAYSYAFDGQWGSLDHALASPGLRNRVTLAADWHINADEPAVLDYNTDFKSAAQIADLYAPDGFRVSDHDPVLVDLSFQSLPIVEPSGFVFNRTTGRFVQGVTFRNVTGAAIAGPIYYALDNLSANATLNAPSGVTSNVPPLGSPYVTVLAPGASLAPGAAVTVTLQFTNPSRTAIVYSGRVLSGPTPP